MHEKKKWECKTSLGRFVAPLHRCTAAPSRVCAKIFAAESIAAGPFRPNAREMDSC